MSKVKVRVADASATSVGDHLGGILDAVGGLIDITGTPPPRIKKHAKKPKLKKRSRLRVEQATGGLGRDRERLDVDTAKAVAYTVQILNLPPLENPKKQPAMRYVAGVKAIGAGDGEAGKHG